MSDIKKELLDKVSECKNIDDVVTLLNDNGINLTKEAVEKKFFKNDIQELSDDDLNNVTGGVGVVDVFASQLTKFIKTKLIDFISEQFK